MTCPNCRGETSPDDERCPHCSLALTVTCPVCAEHVQPGDEEECPHCGASLTHATGVA